MNLNNFYADVFHKGREKQITQESINEDKIRFLFKVVDLIFEARTPEYFDNIVKDAKILITEITKAKQDHP